MKSALKILQSEKSGTKYTPDKDLQSKFRCIELTCRLQSFLRAAGKTAILLNKKLKGPCRRIKRDKLSGSNSKIKRLLKDEKKLERTEKDPTGNNSTKEKSSEKNDSPLEIIE